MDNKRVFLLNILSMTPLEYRMKYHKGDMNITIW